ncbi:hypothetical protein OXX79_005769, partial [Metschnikowia pulcherrima]
MLPGLFLNGLVQIAFFCSLASAVNTGPVGAGQASDSANALTKSRPKYTNFNNFFIERSYGKKFTGEETPATPKSPEISTASELSGRPESRMAPEVQNQLEKEKQANFEQNQAEKEKHSNASSGFTSAPVLSGGETVLEPEKQAGSEQIQLEKAKESNTTSTSITAPVISEGEKVLEPENQSEINRPEDKEKMGNSTNIEPVDPESKQMNESSGKGVANEENTLRKSTETSSPQNATCPDIDLILAELNQEAPLSDKGVAEKDASFNALSAEIASKYASCPDIDVVLAQLNRTGPKANTHGFVQDLQGQKELSMLDNKEVSPQAETESGAAEARVLGHDTVLSK